jgi:integrase
MDPVTPEMLLLLVQNLARPDASLRDVRVVALCLVMYAGFFRFDEISNVRCCDVVFEDQFMRIFIVKAKNDVYRDGNWVVIAKTGNDTCPVGMLCRYFRLAGICPESEQPIFRALIYLKKSSRYILRDSGKLSYTRAREIIIQCFKQIGFHSLRIGTHSLRAGGASAAANAGVGDRLFKRHGRWASDKSKDMYVRDDIRNRLAVSMALGV